MTKTTKPTKPTTKKPTAPALAATVRPATLRSQLWHRRNWWQRGIIILALIVFTAVTSGYGISYWYLNKHRNDPLMLGTTFIPSYARYLGVDPQETMQAAIDELGVKRFRLVSYWDEIERDRGTYDFTELDWQFAKAEAADVDISLSLGLRQPRWPECHMPDWAKGKQQSEWYPELKDFMTAVVERYKDSPSLYTYQVENEFFMTVFGKCEDFDRARLVDEYNLVKKLDPDTPIVVTRSNNWGGVPINEPTPDYYGVAVYKRVWDSNIMKRYFEYPYPPWFYGFLAGAGEIVKGKPMIIHELQTEPWMPPGFDLATAPLYEQDKSMNADRLGKRIQYGLDTGIRTVDTWGMEWWYARKVVHNDPSLWNTAKEKFDQAKQM